MKKLFTVISLFGLVSGVSAMTDSSQYSINSQEGSNSKVKKYKLQKNISTPEKERVLEELRNQIIDETVFDEAAFDLKNSLLMLATLEGNRETACRLLKNGADPIAKNAKGRTALMISFDLESFNLSRLFINHIFSKGDSEDVSKKLIDLLNTAPKSKRKVVENYLDFFLQDLLNTETANKVKRVRKQLVSLVKKGKIQELKKLLKKHSEIHLNEVLSLAAKFSQLEIAKYAIDQGANPNVKDKKGNTPIMRAIKNNDIKLFWYLHSSGATIEQKDNDDYTPLSYAVKNNPIDKAERQMFLGAVYDSKKSKVSTDSSRTPTKGLPNSLLKNKKSIPSVITITKKNEYDGSVISTNSWDVLDGCLLEGMGEIFSRNPDKYFEEIDHGSILDEFDNQCPFLSLNLDPEEMDIVNEKLFDLRRKSDKEKGLFADSIEVWNRIADTLKYHIIIYERQDNYITGIYEYGKRYDRMKRIILTNNYGHYSAHYTELKVTSK